ncbi:MAG: hypothetical protein K6T75_03900 [Acetobacteraceae bacterium]|nr:hypothetical protein [Acetobacteraceae bacterium]
MIRGGMRFLAIFRASLLSRTGYLGEVVARCYFVALAVFVLGQLWIVVYGQRGPGPIAGLSLPQML